MENFIIATNAVVPFMVYIAIGMIAKKLGLVKESFLRELNGVIFRVFFPFIMFNNLYKADFSTLKDADYVLFAVIATLIVIALSVLLVPVFEKENPRKGVIIQAIFRSNSVLFAIPLAGSVLGEEASIKSSIIVAFLVPMYNIFSVMILEYYRGGKVKIFVIAKNILKNPLIMGAIAGAIFNLLPVTMPDSLAHPITQLSNLATPMALFVLGGTLKFSDLRKNAVPVAVGVIIKLIIVPAIVSYAMALLRYEPAELFAVFCMFATPVAAASFPMAQSMGADADLAGEYVVVTTLLSIVTIFVWILVLKNFGLI
ncbi:MAG: AEC family transporter [Butyrivibrio sp.]|nr:AEC family transporter [Butyrivibrio sp.]MBQ8030337.1 AEC family transporter [Butyrivibrio sp.]MBR1641217.1 AEC family transporter [Butyrivibrio sp.]